MMCMRPGRRYPQVFPEPVFAMAMTSRFDMAAAHDCDWMGVGSLKPARAISSIMSRGNCAASKLTKGSGSGSSPCDKEESFSFWFRKTSDRAAKGAARTVTTISNLRRYSCTSGELVVATIAEYCTSAGR